jgi:hypothetical protein
VVINSPTVGIVKLRPQPNTSNQEVGIITHTLSVNILGKNLSKEPACKLGWWFVEVPKGWICIDFTSYDFDIGSVPTYTYGN